MEKFKPALKKAVATFVFATTGTLIGNPVFNLNVAVWKVAAATGLGALINLAYRWSEAVINGRKF
jgi:hypothetical protein